MDLVGHRDPDVHPTALELDVVVAREHVGEVAQPCRRLLARDSFLLLDLEDVHHVSFVVGLLPEAGSRPAAICSSAPAVPEKLSGMRADGEAPGCCGAMRTRSTPCRIRKRRGGSSVAASPSMPAWTGWPASTSNDGTVHSRHGRWGRRPCAPRPVAPPATVMPSSPSSIFGRVPDPMARPSR